MSTTALVDRLERWSAERYPTVPFDRARYENALTSRVPYRPVELDAALADWKLDRPPLASEVTFRLRRGREGREVADTIAALRSELRAARHRHPTGAASDARVPVGV